MIDWVHSLGGNWGHWVRKAEQLDSALQGTLGRIVDEGPEGAAIRSAFAFTQRVPVTDFPEDVAEFHRAWLRLVGPNKYIIWVDYKLKVPVAEKFRLTGKKKDAYYRQRSRAQAAMVYYLANTNHETLGFRENVW